MRTEVVISSAYEAAWCQLKGFTCRMIPASQEDDVEYVFDDNKSLKEARRQFEEDVDLQEFIEALRRLKWTAKNARQGRTAKEAPRSRS